MSKGPITIDLRFRPPRDSNNAAYFKPVGGDGGRGPSLWVNRSFVDEYFQGVKPERAMLSLTVCPVPVPRQIGHGESFKK